MTEQIKNSNFTLTDEAILVVAHPDDEVLWFSSILADVAGVVICFLEVPGRPVWTEGRRNSIDTVPLNSLTNLGITESDAFYMADWSNPVETEYGLELPKTPAATSAYRNNFEKLKIALRPQLEGFKNVITHNPWGEYGHIEHVQVYRAIKALQAELHFELWFSNYCSNKSMKLMLRYAGSLTESSGPMETNIRLAREISDIYKKNNCWTWYDYYQWTQSEVFFRDRHSERVSQPSAGSTHCLNLIVIGEDPPPPQTRSRLGRFRRKIARSFRALFPGVTSST